FIANRSGAPCESQAGGQSVGEPVSVRVEPGSQAVRGTRHTVADLAEIEPVHYEGVVWCLTVPTGAFVARRNGKVFVTGNSGFPKSHDVGKAIDKRPGASQHPEFGAALRAAMTAKGYTNTFDVAEVVLGKRTGAVANWIKYQFPEARWWPALRDLLDMDEARWGPVIAEAERQVTGKHGAGSPIGTFTASIDGGPPPEAKD